MYDEKNKLSAIMMVLVLVMAAALTGCSDKKAKEQEIQNKVAAIDTAYEAFTAEADHAKKLEAYKTMVSEDEAYTEKDAVKEKYTAVLADMKKAFTDEYDSTIAENTVDVSKEEDEKKVSTYKDNLTKALGTIKADAVCTDEEITAYEASVNAAVKTYDDRVTAIKKAAAEKKAEEEAKAKKESEKAAAAAEAEATEAAKSSGSSSSYSSSSSGVLHTVILIIQAAAIPVHQAAQITTMHMRTTMMMMIVIHPVRTMAVHHQAAVPVLNHQAVHPDQKVGTTLGQLAA